MIWFLGVFPSRDVGRCRLSVCATDGTHYVSLIAGAQVLALQLCSEHADELADWFQCPGKVKGIVDLFLLRVNEESTAHRARGRWRHPASRNLCLPGTPMKPNRKGLL